MTPSRTWSIALWLAAYAACGPIPAPNPPTPKPPVVVAVSVASTTDGRPIGGATVWHQPAPSVTRETDLTGAASLPVSAVTSGVCAKKPGFHSPGLPAQAETCAPLSSASIRLGLEANPPPAPLPTPTPVVHPDGQIFRDATNGPWRWKGVSAFKLARRYQLGENIGPFFDAYRGYNILRVWPYVTWTGTGWEAPTVDVLKAFLHRCASEGFLVELTLLTDDDPARIPWAKSLVVALAAAPRPTNLLIEIGNEPETHKHINTQALKATLDASGFVYASGNYEQNAKAFGSFGDAHTARDSEWPRKAHDLMEYFHGKGPHATTDVARPYPWVADEPAKTQDVAAPKPPLTKADDWRAYFGTASLLGAGGTFHCETCKYADLPTAEERTLAAAALEGLNAFPADAPKGHYARPSDSSLRTYTIAPPDHPNDAKWMVRVRPTTAAPSGNWTRIGNSNILWKR